MPEMTIISGYVLTSSFLTDIPRNSEKKNRSMSCVRSIHALFVNFVDPVCYNKEVKTVKSIFTGFSESARRWLKNWQLRVLSPLLFGELEKCVKVKATNHCLLLHPSHLLQNLMRTLYLTIIYWWYFWWCLLLKVSILYFDQTIFKMSQFKMPCGTYDPLWLISKLNTGNPPR